jgi:translation initiation factor 3 subunit C
VKQPKARRWAFSSSSESEDAGGRVAKSKKDKRFEELNQIIKQIKNHINITDFTALLTDFENLNKEKQKAKQIIENEGMPKFYYKGLALLEDSLAEITKEAQKKFNKQNNRAFNTLKNKLKKHNKEYETELKEYREVD